MSNIVKENVLVQLTLLVLGCALYWTTFTVSFSDVGSAHSPVFFPRIILTLWIGLSLISLCQSLMATQTATPVHSLGRLAVLIVAVILYSNMITIWGFFLCSVVLAVIALPLFGVRHPAIVIAYSLLVPGALVALFNHMLGMPLPTSPFTYLF